ncbi:ubiquitin domain-containing protein 1 [Tanacetum coccineum]
MLALTLYELGNRHAGLKEIVRYLQLGFKRYAILSGKMLPKQVADKIWDALRAAAEGDLRNAEKMIRDDKISLGNLDMTVGYDESGTSYNLPLYILNANNDDARTCSYKEHKMVRKPKPWDYGNSPLSLRELQQMCNEFWHNAMRTGGRREIWEALRAATEGNLLNEQNIIKDKNIRLGNQDMSVCYDDNDKKLAENAFERAGSIDPSITVQWALGKGTKPNEAFDLHMTVIIEGGKMGGLGNGSVFKCEPATSI